MTWSLYSIQLLPCPLPTFSPALSHRSGWDSGHFGSSLGECMQTPSCTSTHNLNQLPWTIAWTSGPSRLCTQTWTLHKVSGLNLGSFQLLISSYSPGSPAWSLLAGRYTHTEKIHCTPTRLFSTRKWLGIEFNKNIEQTAVIRQPTRLLTSSVSTWMASFTRPLLPIFLCFFPSSP